MSLNTQIITESQSPWVKPEDVDWAQEIVIECIGSGANGQIGADSSGGSGGGGGAYSKTTLVLDPEATYEIQVLPPSEETPVWFRDADGPTVICEAASGQLPDGGAAFNCIGDVKFSGGKGGDSDVGRGGGGGGGAAASEGDGEAGLGGSPDVGGSPGAGGLPDGGGGGAGGNQGAAGSPGQAYGGGGGGGGNPTSGTTAGGAGGSGVVKITYHVLEESGWPQTRASVIAGDDSGKVTSTGGDAPFTRSTTGNNHIGADAVTFGRNIDLSEYQGGTAHLNTKLIVTISNFQLGGGAPEDAGVWLRIPERDPLAGTEEEAWFDCINGVGLSDVIPITGNGVLEIPLSQAGLNVLNYDNWLGRSDFRIAILSYGFNLATVADSMTFELVHTPENPKVVKVKAVGQSVVRVYFSKPMGAGTTDPANYVVSGTGKGTLADNPDSVVQLDDQTYELTWNEGAAANQGLLYITVTDVVDANEVPIGDVNSGYSDLPLALMSPLEVGSGGYPLRAGTFKVVKGLLRDFSIVGQEVSYANGLVGPYVIEVLLEMDANGEAEVETPVVADMPIVWQFKRGSGSFEPTQPFTVQIQSIFGRLSGHRINLLSASGGSNISPVGVAAFNHKSAGPLVVRLHTSHPDNAGKQALVAIMLAPAYRLILPI